MKHNDIRYQEQCANCDCDIWIKDGVRHLICPHCGAKLREQSSEDADEGCIMPAKQPSPIEEIIDYSKAKDSILTSIDLCEAREALGRIRAENRGFVYLTKSEFCYLYKAFHKMEEQIKNLTADNLQLMQQIEARGTERRSE